ncbi:MAG: magnesium transporter CorA family protein [Spirochaetes bacterium]|nr:magnesium transporter CorA family protein [Spirochaetota bacterium]
MIEKLTNNNLTWINIQNPTQEDLDYLKKTYKFHDLDLEDCRSKVQRPKFEEYDEYKFIVLHFPIMPRSGYRLTMEEADIFWGKNYIITLHSNSLSKMTNIFNSLRKDEENLKKYFSKGSDYLLYKILHEMVLMIFPLMNQISNEIDFLDTSFDTIKPSKMIERMSALRRNIIFLQTSLKPQKGIFLIFENQLADQEQKDMDVYWGDIGDYIGKLLDTAEDYQELTDGLYSSIDTLLTYRMNNIMKTLTIFSVIMLPLSFITGFYGMNVRLPLENTFGDSLITAGIITGFMGIVAITMIMYFKIRKF